MAKCKVCKKEFQQFRTTQNVCSTSCALKYSKDKQKKKEEQRERNEKMLSKFDKEIKEKKSYQRLLLDARKYFQRWIRKRDEKQGCISCGSKSDLVDAGHYFKAEVYSGIIFNENNCHSQCRKCNRYLNGNEINYRMGLVERYGEEFVQELEQIKDANRLKKWTREDLLEIKNKYINLLKT